MTLIPKEKERMFLPLFPSLTAEPLVRQNYTSKVPLVWHRSVKAVHIHMPLDSHNHFGSDSVALVLIFARE